MRRAVLVLAVLAVLATMGAGFYLIGPPADARARRLDQRRVHDLERLRLAIDLFWTRHQRLPPTLTDLAAEAGTGIYSRDPETEDPYEYRVTGARAYELCATFGRESVAAGFWSHPAGRQCYPVNAREIRP